MFNIVYGCRIVLSFSFRTSLHILNLLECGLFTRPVGNPHCDILAGRIKSAFLNFRFPGILSLYSCKDNNIV